MHRLQRRLAIKWHMQLDKCHCLRGRWQISCLLDQCAALGIWQINLQTHGFKYEFDKYVRGCGVRAFRGFAGSRGMGRGCGVAGVAGLHVGRWLGCGSASLLNKKVRFSVGEN